MNIYETEEEVKVVEASIEAKQAKELLGNISQIEDFLKKHLSFQEKYPAFAEFFQHLKEVLSKLPSMGKIPFTFEITVVGSREKAGKLLENIERIINYMGRHLDPEKRYPALCEFHQRLQGALSNSS